MNVLDHLRVVLVSPRNPLNVGAAARAMSNFGCFDMRLVNAYRVAVDEARSAVKAGAVLEKAREFTSLAEAIADCSLVVGTTSIGNRELQHTIRRLEAGGRLIRKHLAGDGGPKVAILFGSEKFGLSNDDLTHCDWLMRIPTREEHGSMNLGQAVAVTLYELIRNPRPVRAEPRAKQAATSAQLERFTALLIDSLRASGYVNEKTADSTVRKARRLVKRLDVPRTDAEVWQGMLRQILWKLHHRSAVSLEQVDGAKASPPDPEN